MHWANWTVTPPSVACECCEPELPAPDWPGPESPAVVGVVAVVVVVVVALRLATDALGLPPHAAAAIAIALSTKARTAPRPIGDLNNPLGRTDMASS
jgi:hypothetical protein